MVAAVVVLVTIVKLRRKYFREGRRPGKQLGPHLLHQQEQQRQRLQEAHQDEQTRRTLWLLHLL